MTESELEPFDMVAVRKNFQGLLTKHSLTYNDFESIGKNCTLQCGCSLYDVDSTGNLHWYFKNRDLFELNT